MNPILILGGIVAALVIVALCRKRPADDDAIYYDENDDEEVSTEATATPEFSFMPGRYYRWDQIEPFVWALGYSKGESDAMYTRSYAEIRREGFHAEFDATMGYEDADRESLFMCHAFDPQADTRRMDMWHRTPSSDALAKYR